MVLTVHLDNHKEVQMICGTRCPKRLLKWLKRRWVSLEVLDLGVKNRGVRLSDLFGYYFYD